MGAALGAGRRRLQSLLPALLIAILVVLQPLAFAADVRAASRSDMAAHAAAGHAPAIAKAATYAAPPCPHTADATPAPATDHGAVTDHAHAAPDDSRNTGHDAGHDDGTCALVCAALALSLAVSPVTPQISVPAPSATRAAAAVSAPGLHPAPPTPPPRRA